MKSGEALKPININRCLQCNYSCKTTSNQLQMQPATMCCWQQSALEKGKRYKKGINYLASTESGDSSTVNRTISASLSNWTRSGLSIFLRRELTPTLRAVVPLELRARWMTQITPSVIEGQKNSSADVTIGLSGMNVNWPSGSLALTALLLSLRLPFLSFLPP